MRTYISAVTVNVSGRQGYETETAARLTIDSGGNAEVELRYTPRRHPEESERREEATNVAIEAGLIRWATVGPQGGEDSVLVATAALMDQLHPLFGTPIVAPGEEE